MKHSVVVKSNKSPLAHKFPSVRASQEMAGRLKAEADRQKRSVASLIRNILEAEIRNGFRQSSDQKAI